MSVSTGDRGSRLPPFMQSLAWVFFPTEFMAHLQRRHGDAFEVRMAGFPPVHITSHPDEVKDVFGGDPATLEAGVANVILKPLVGPGSLLLLDGARHQRHRRLMLPPFHGERMHAYGETIREVAADTIARWPLGRQFPLHREMQEVTLQVILRTVFGMRAGPRRDRLADALKRLLAFGEQPWLMLLIDGDGGLRGERVHARLGRLSPWLRFQAVRREVDEALDAEIARLRAEPSEERDDVLALLVAARDEDGAGLTDAELRDEMVTLLIAGHETTATALTWTVAELARNPEVRATLRQRLAAGDHEYADACAKEALRLHPIVPMVARRTTVPLRLGGRELPAGSYVAPSMYLAQRHPDRWPEPEAFRPERFVGKKVSPAEFFPFGGGARRCLGAAFALYEMRVVLEELERRTTLHLAPGYRLRVARRGITFAPARGLPVIATA